MNIKYLNHMSEPKLVYLRLGQCIQCKAYGTPYNLSRIHFTENQQCLKICSSSPLEIDKRKYAKGTSWTCLLSEILLKNLEKSSGRPVGVTDK